MWPDERVASFVAENFIPARVHVKDDAAEFQKYGEKYSAQWTPTVLELDTEGVERHRIEGFLPADDFLAQLMLGRAKIDFQDKKWDEAVKLFRRIYEELPDTDAAPEALYWTGVSRYKDTNDATTLKETARAFTTRYSDSAWAKKASIWA
ncbi:MAG: tetratricopeptide repeat protein [Gemmatimonadota bacterium]|nr:tetratricopeptide repeat protein [Gemmatimonadota bacterium]